MTDRTQHVLDAIDHALEDWTVSDDAMRWMPQHDIPFGLEHRRPIGFRGGRVPPPRQQGRELLAFVDRCVPAVWQAAVLADVFGIAVREAAEAMSRLFHASREDVETLAATLAQLIDVDEQDEAIAEDPRARALRLLQHRNTGPGRAPAGRQKRPRRLA